MTDTVQEQNDRIAITDVINRYGTTIDEGDYEGLANCFTPDSITRYGGGREFRGGEAVAEFVKSMTPDFVAQQHLLGNHEIVLDGDRATATTYLHATQIEREEAGGGVVVTGGIYRDVLVRTAGGWRIAERELEGLWRERREPPA
ncbi:MAG: nuclear transport factor 2 family protein [Dehalococcoidia bacterium]|nr:nuclear transport factor 2 family protein [Dehalococcoidia bacterium]